MVQDAIARMYMNTNFFDYAYRPGSTADVVVQLAGVLEMFSWTSQEDPLAFYKCFYFHTTMVSACILFCNNKPNDIVLMQMIGNQSLVTLPNLV